MEGENERADLLYGVAAIARFLGLKERPCRYKVDAGLIPTFKPFGNIICARRSALNTWLTEQQAAGRSPGAPITADVRELCGSGSSSTEADILALLRSDHDVSLTVTSIGGAWSVGVIAPGRPAFLGRGETFADAWRGRAPVRPVKGGARGKCR